jgi:DNA-binding MarR family transcriptional regulator
VDAVADRLHAAALHLLRRLRIEDETLGISAPRLSALSVLVLGGPRRIGELADAEQVEPPTMTRLVDALERDGYVTRTADPDDRRAVVISATASGTRALNKGRSQRVEALAVQLRSLTPDQLAILANGVGVLEGIIASPGQP